jgi:hypothetical protein
MTLTFMTIELYRPSVRLKTAVGTHITLRLVKGFYSSIPGSDQTPSSLALSRSACQICPCRPVSGRPVSGRGAKDGCFQSAWLLTHFDVPSSRLRKSLSEIRSRRKVHVRLRRDSWYTAPREFVSGIRVGLVVCGTPHQGSRPPSGKLPAGWPHDATLPLCSQLLHRSHQMASYHLMSLARGTSGTVPISLKKGNIVAPVRSMAFHWPLIENIPPVWRSIGRS